MRCSPIGGIGVGLLSLGAVIGATAMQATGTIEGRVVFEGPTPPPTAVAESGGTQPVLHVDRRGGLRYAVVYLPDAQPSEAPLPPPVTVNQRRFMFEPQVLVVRAGQAVRFTNGDTANHNVRAQDAHPENTFSINTGPGAGAPDARRFVVTAGHRPLQLSCDIHPWMSAWIYVFEHDQFAVTAADGRFEIAGVPPGRHRVAVRQPAGRLERDLAVDVRSGEVTQLTIRFTPADLGMPSR